MASFQLPFGVDITNPVPVDKKYGPFANVAAACAAIPLAVRFDGLTVQITGSGNYWWLNSDLTDPGLIAKAGDLSTCVRTTGDQTIQGIKDFTGTDTGADYKFEIHNGSPDLYVFDPNPAGLAPYFACFRAQGSASTPTPVQNGANMGGVTYFGYDGTDYGSSSGRMTAFATEDFNVGAHGTQLVFQTTPNGTNTKVVSLILGQDGNVIADKVGATFKVTSGSNALSGTVTLSAGAGTITSTALDTQTAIILSRQVTSGAGVYPQINLAIGSATLQGSGTDNGTYVWIALKKV